MKAKTHGQGGGAEQWRTKGARNTAAGEGWGRVEPPCNDILDTMNSGVGRKDGSKFPEHRNYAHSAT